MKGSHRDHLELLQYLFMVLSKYSTIHGYDPHERRRLTQNKGLRGKIPIPMLRQAKFDVHGRVEHTRKLVNIGEKVSSLMWSHLPTVGNLDLIIFPSKVPMKSSSTHQDLQ